MCKNFNCDILYIQTDSLDDCATLCLHILSMSLLESLISKLDKRLSRCTGASTVLLDVLVPWSLGHCWSRNTPPPAREVSSCTETRPLAQL